MGEYFSWVNVDKNQYISPNDFDFGNKVGESSFKGNTFLCALKDLLASDWKEDHIVWLGDQVVIPENESNPVIKVLVKEVKKERFVTPMDVVWSNNYTNISGLFKAAEEKVRHEIDTMIEYRYYEEKDFWNEYKVDIKDPYKGFFQRMGREYEYVINKDKKIAYSTRKSKVLRIEEDDVIRIDKIEPLPFLMAYGCYYIGAWLGDRIGVSDDLPEGVTLMEDVAIKL